jgi:hypothetical protein
VERRPRPDAKESDLKERRCLTGKELRDIARFDQFGVIRARTGKIGKSVTNADQLPPYIGEVDKAKRRELSMKRHCLERSVRSLVAISRAGLLVATVAAAIPASSVTSFAEQPSPATQLRDEAPIGHRQPRIQDLPPDVVRDEKKMQTEQDALDKRLENSICRGC